MQVDSSDALESALAEALVRRAEDMNAAAVRLQGFAFAPGEESPDLVEGEGLEGPSLRDLALRALGRAVDPVNFALLERLAESESSVGELMGSLALPRSAVSERVNDLLQVGLVGRTHKGDGATLTPAGRAVVDLVAGVVERGQRRP